MLFLVNGCGAKGAWFNVRFAVSVHFLSIGVVDADSIGNGSLDTSGDASP